LTNKVAPFIEKIGNFQIHCRLQTLKNCQICKAHGIEPNNINLRLVSDFQRVECSQLVLHYQPQFSLSSQRITHVEALIRWQHPELGLLPPLQFIPILEESGGIEKVTRWVVSETVRLLQKTEASFSISLNITTRDLVNDDFCAFVQRQMRELDASRLVFEVTETGIFEDSGRAQQNIKALHALGIQFAVDDFGTGYSSLSYLNEIAFQEVKIDRSFVSKLLTTNRAKAIVRSTVQLAKELGLNVVAEGVEDKATLDSLASFGVDRIQGYYIAKPMPEEQLSAYIS